MFAFASKCPETGFGFGFCVGSGVGVLHAVVEVVQVVVDINLLVPEVAADAGVVLVAGTLLLLDDEILEMMTARVDSNSALGPGKFILLLLSVDERPAYGRA